MIKNKEELILDFIKQFRDLGSENCFSNGMCYWFVHILKTRFNNEHCHTMYDQVANHFACEINGRIYDITGDVTNSEEYNWETFYAICADDALLRRLERDCMWKIPCDTMICGICPVAYEDDALNLHCPHTGQPYTFNHVCEGYD